MTLSTPRPFLARGRSQGQTLPRTLPSLEMPVWLRCHSSPTLGHLGGRPLQTTSAPYLSSSLAKARMLPSRDLRTSGMSMAGATPIRSQLDWPGGRCRWGVLEAAGEAGSGPGRAAGSGGRQGGSEAANGRTGPSPCVHRLGHLPALAAARPSPSRCPGRAGLAWRQHQHVEPQRQSSDREPGVIYFAKGSSPPGWEPEPGLPGKNSELAARPQQACTAHSRPTRQRSSRGGQAPRGPATLAAGSWAQRMYCVGECRPTSGRHALS